MTTQPYTSRSTGREDKLPVPRKDFETASPAPVHRKVPLPRRVKQFIDADDNIPRPSTTLLFRDRFDTSSGDMALINLDMNALRALLREEIQAEIAPFRAEVMERFSEIAGQIDGLYLRDEKREQEYISLRAQVTRLEQKQN